MLHAGTLVSVRDSVCREPRSGPRAEVHAHGFLVQVTRAGVYATHRCRNARDTIVAEPGQLLLFNRGDPFRISHPADGGDRTTAVEFSEEAVRDAAVRHDPAAWRDGAPAFQARHVRATPAVLLPLQRLRRALATGMASALEAEETTLGILDTVMRDSARQRDVRGVAQRLTTRRARRELVEAVKARLAAAPERDVTLPALARDVAASPAHLARTFRAEVGVPIHQYLLGLRLNLALDRLVESPESLATLALDLGFANHAHFTTRFRRRFGVAPSVARRSLRLGA